MAYFKEVKDGARLPEERVYYVLFAAEDTLIEKSSANYVHLGVSAINIPSGKKLYIKPYKNTYRIDEYCVPHTFEEYLNVLVYNDSLDFSMEIYRGTAVAAAYIE